jgi:photosystem II stability/assembly factor-like uncharacterized protein
MKARNIPVGFFLFILLFAPGISHAQWSMATGLEGGKLKSMVSVDTTLVAVCAERGIFSKTDHGQWQPSFFANNYQKLTKADHCIFAYSSNYGDYVLRSFDEGQTWENAYAFGNSWDLITIDTVVFFHLSQPIKRSFDYGTTSQTINFLTQIPILNVLTDDSLLYMHCYDSDTTHQLFFSSDYGDSWDSITTGGLFDQPYANVQQMKYMNGQFWAVLQGISAPYSESTLFRFNPDLNRWEETTYNLPRFAQHRDLTNFEGEIYCSKDGYPVFKFNEADSSWSATTDGSKNVIQFLTHDDNLYCTTDQGAFSLDGSGDWTEYNAGLTYREITSIDVQDGKIYAAASNELFVSDDGGNHFTKNETGYGFQIITTDTAFYMIAPHEFRISRDQGLTWTSHSENLEGTYNPRLTHLSITPQYYYISSNGGFYRSPSDRISWSKLESYPLYSWIDSETVEAIQNTILVPDIFYTEQLFFSDDYGQTFSIYDRYGRLAKNNETYYLLSDSIFFSPDLGQSWNNIPLDEPGLGIRCVDVKGDTMLFGGDNNFNPRIKMTWNQGESWTDLLDNLPVFPNWNHTRINQIKIADGRILVGNPQFGLWYRDDILTSSRDKNSIDRVETPLLKAFPNPCTISTTIEFAVGNTADIHLVVYNVLGEAVFSLSENMNAGKKQLIWKTQSLPSGVYTCVLDSGSHPTACKIVVKKK